MATQPQNPAIVAARRILETTEQAIVEAKTADLHEFAGYLADELHANLDNSAAKLWADALRGSQLLGLVLDDQKPNDPAARPRSTP